jgi:hypothetical protein
MLRLIIVIMLLLLNLGWWIWAQAGLSTMAMSPGEPERLTRQIHPDALQVRPLPPGSPIVKTVPASAAPNAAVNAVPAASNGVTPTHPQRRQNR